MYFGRKLIATAISFSTLLVASNGYAEIAPFFNDEEEIRELDSCSCSFSDIVGSDFSCTTPGESSYVFDIPDFGETDSICTISAGDVSSDYPFVSSDDTSAFYLGGSLLTFVLDPSPIEQGRCSLSGSVCSFGCWACPPTTSPTLVPTDSPSVQPSVQPSENVNPTDDVGNNDIVDPTDDVGNNDSVDPTDDDENNEENDEECWIFTLFSSLQKLFLIEN